MNNIKAVCIRLPKELWLYLKKKSMDKEMSVNKIMEGYILRAKSVDDKRKEKRLTKSDSMIS